MLRRRRRRRRKKKRKWKSKRRRRKRRKRKRNKRRKRKRKRYVSKDPKTAGKVSYEALMYSERCCVLKVSGGVCCGSVVR